jgi:hypothetical protein
MDFHGSVDKPRSCYAPSGRNGVRIGRLFLPLVSADSAVIEIEADGAVEV